MLIQYVAQQFYFVVFRNLHFLHTFEQFLNVAVFEVDVVQLVVGRDDGRDGGLTHGVTHNGSVGWGWRPAGGRARKDWRVAKTQEINHG